MCVYVHVCRCVRVRVPVRACVLVPPYPYFTVSTINWTLKMQI